MVMEPIRQRMLSLLKDRGYLDAILKKGADKARGLALQHLNEVQDMVGFLKV